jgi:polyferredoxin
MKIRIEWGEKKQVPLWKKKKRARIVTWIICIVVYVPLTLYILWFFLINGGPRKDRRYNPQQEEEIYDARWRH